MDFLIENVRLEYKALPKALSDNGSLELKETYEAVLAAMKSIEQAVRTQYPDSGVRVAVSMSESDAADIQIYGDALKQLEGLIESVAI